MCRQRAWYCWKCRTHRCCTLLFKSCANFLSILRPVFEAAFLYGTLSKIRFICFIWTRKVDIVGILQLPIIRQIQILTLLIANWACFFISQVNKHRFLQIIHFFYHLIGSRVFFIDLFINVVIDSTFNVINHL